MRKKPLCNAPWMTLYREQDGSVSPCCESSFPYHNVHASQTNEEIFRHPEVEEFKRQLLDGEWPARCINCKTQEERNQRSHRQVVSHPRFETELDIEKFHMRFLDHRSSNICNFSCKMCSSHLSSTHALINKQPYAREFGESQNYPANGIIEMPTTIDNVIDDIGDIKHLQFAGGEPLLMNSTWDLMDMVIESGRADQVSMGLITNGSLLNRNEQDLIERCLQFKIAHVTVSVDALGEAHDYWRHKGSWQAVKKNLEQMIDAQVENKFEVNIRTTIGWPTAWRAREVYEEYSDKVFRHYTGFINGPRCWSVDQLDQEEIDRLAEFYKDWPEPHKLFANTKSNRSQKDMLDAYHRTFKFDKYHNNSIVDVFPEHKEFIETHLIPDPQVILKENIKHLTDNK